jgi:hypothetical protein
MDGVSPCQGCSRQPKGKKPPYIEDDDTPGHSGAF